MTICRFLPISLLLCTAYQITQKMPSSIYVLGTGLSHNGSAVLLKDGKVCVAIEKERLTRRKHDGGNDTDAIRYCLDAEGITLQDIAVVVQCANFEIPDRDRYRGKRLFAETDHPPLISISHQLAHAWSAAGTCPFNEAVIMVIDGCGSPYEQCTDLGEGQIFPVDIESRSKGSMWCEKDSFYRFDGKRMTALRKDFSPMAVSHNERLRMQTTQHSIGGFYAAVSHYVFGNMDDVGKLMGLAPYGRSGTIGTSVFFMEEGSLFVREGWSSDFNRPSSGYEQFRADFQYYADVALWAQQQVEKAIAACFRERLKEFPHENVCYSGGVALNAVANARLLNDELVRNLYMEPAAGDNGLALGCAFYGWMTFLDKEKVPHNGSTCFGRSYDITNYLPADFSLPVRKWKIQKNDFAPVARLLAAGKTVGWFDQACEFGPRALGHRSILGHPGIPGLGDHINANIKFREDFRPFAPAVLPGFAETCFESGRESPYMILVDRTRAEWKERLRNVTHVNGTARVQTIEKDWNSSFYALTEAFYNETGIPVLLNTSFNKKGMPIVETPEEAIALFCESALDVLVLGENVFEKIGENVN